MMPRNRQTHLFPRRATSVLDYVSKIPPIIVVMLVAMFVGLILTSMTPELWRVRFQSALELSPWKMAQGPVSDNWYGFTLFGLVTYGFIHVNGFHLLANAVFLIAFGTPVAARLGGAGPLGRAAVWPGILRFLGFLFGGFIVAGAMYVVLNWGKSAPVVGASGGVAALVGASVRFLFREDAQYGYLFGTPAPLWSKNVLLPSCLIIGFELLTGVLGSSYMINGVWRVVHLQSIGLLFYQIAWEAHIGGYLFGVLSYPFFDRLAGAEARVPVNIHASTPPPPAV